MENLNSAQALLNQQDHVAIWYAEYNGPDECILYANEYFSEIFEISIAQILDKGRYHLVNPPDTPEEIIERYKEEDREAIRNGVFISRASFEVGKDIVVVKLRFDQGVLGLFQFFDSEPAKNKMSVHDLNAEIEGVVRRVRPDLFE